jgi:hypothetical protein
MKYANVFIDSNWLLVEYGGDPHLVVSREGPRCPVLLMVRFSFSLLRPPPEQMYLFIV